MANLALRGLGKDYGAVTAVAGIDLTIDEGEIVAFVGPSGCGKTTILRMIAGLIEPDRGQVVIGDDDVTYAPVHKRNLGLVFQSYALFPHLSVFENVAFGLRRRGVSEPALKERVEGALDLVKLGAFGERYPKQLSGGQQQRVALARAVVTEPRVLLLDEPLSNLDALLRDEMRVEIKRLQQRLGITTIFVTHDQEEALTLADRVAILNGGRLEQIGRPQEVYDRPASRFVAGFLGKANFLAARVVAASGSRLELTGPDGVALQAVGTAKVGDAVELVLRREKVRLSKAGEPGQPGVIAIKSFAGATTQYVIRLDSGLEMIADAPAVPAFEQGEAVSLGWDPADVIVLPRDNPANG